MEKYNPKAWTITSPFLIIVLGLFFGLAAWNFYNFLGYKGITQRIDDKEFKQIIGRSPMWYAGLGEGRFFSGVFQDQLEKATADHFPLFAILTYKKIQRFLNIVILYPLPKRIKPLLPLGEDFSLINNTKIIIENPENILNENTQYRLSRRAEYYNRIIKEFPDIRLLVMPILTKFNWFIKANPKFHLESV
ncbi:MAG: hypothetical protein GXP56_00965 [Deltaproteobacteria bacterium]|nr:hypothetical protein [Deltaproteobacteria bacterium]